MTQHLIVAGCTAVISFLCLGAWMSGEGNNLPALLAALLGGVATFVSVAAAVAAARTAPKPTN